jgi:Tol biopolymer transport system component
MKRAIAPILMFMAILVAALASRDVAGTAGPFPILEGPYLGQKPPGSIPQLFAPGIVSTGMDDLNAVFSTDGTEFFFTVKLPMRGRHVMMTMKKDRGRWSAPTVVPFSGRYNDADPAYSPDGKTLYFASTRPPSAGAREKDWDIWAVDRTTGGWGQPRCLDAPVNTQSMEVYPSIAGNGTLYFSSNRSVGTKAGGIFRAIPVAGSYPNVEVFNERIVSEYGGGDIFIAPDERTIIFSSNQAGGYGNSDLHVSFRSEDGAWTAPQNLGPTINSPYQEYCPSLSPDGKYFFFSSYKRPEESSVPAMRSLDDILQIYRQPYNGAGDVYWVDAAVIHALREKSFRQGKSKGSKGSADSFAIPFTVD